MPVSSYKYSFTETEPQKVPVITQRILRELQETMAAEEWLMLRHAEGCEAFLVSDAVPDEHKLRIALRERKLLPENDADPGIVQTSREAIGRFLEIAVGACGTVNGVRLMEMLQREYSRMQEMGAVGSVLNWLFQRGIWLHEKVRQETTFFRFAVEPAAVIDELAQKILGSQSRSRLVVIGNSVPQMHIVDELYRQGYRQITFLGGVGELPGHSVLPVGAGSEPSSFLKKLPENADLLLAFPSATHHLSEALIKERLSGRSKSPLLVFDFSNDTRNLSKINKISDLYVYTPDDIQKVVRHNISERKGAAATVSKLIEQEIDAFYRWHGSSERYSFAGIIGASPQMQRVFEMISRIAQTDITVLIDGESGTGKELVAKAIHTLSNRAERPFFVINCGAIPDNLLESELFGHTKGAFTGAANAKEGMFEAAHRSTLLLDEIGELPPQLQVKLLRALQDGEIKRVGSNETVRVDVRVLAATNKDLAKMVETGDFRSDLFYRLNVIQMTLPPLRQRADDVTLLARHFMDKFSKKLRKDVIGFALETVEMLRNYSWPGNVRELENAVERAVALAVGSRVLPHDLPPHVLNSAQPQNGHIAEDDHLTLKEVERRHILETMEATDWNQEIASKRLGIGRTTLWRKLKEYNMIDNDEDV